MLRTGWPMASGNRFRWLPRITVTVLTVAACTWLWLDASSAQAQRIRTTRTSSTRTGGTTTGGTTTTGTSTGTTRTGGTTSGTTTGGTTHDGTTTGGTTTGGTTTGGTTTGGTTGGTTTGGTTTGGTTTGGTTTSGSSLGKALIQQSDFEWLGAFALPKSANGWSTDWAFSGITFRRVSGQLRLITATHRYSGDALYEVAFPGLSKEYGKWPVAKITNEWANDKTYGNVKKIKGGTESGWTHGLYYDDASKRLYYSFGSWYNIPPTNEPSLGYCTLEPTLQPFGSWAAPADKAHSQAIRGGSLKIPDWFANAYTGGRKLGLGFGGYYSGFAQCAKGPFLAAAHAPTATTTQLDVLPLLGFDDAHWGTRNPDYNSEISWSPNPVNGVGFWGAKDEIYGGCTWIDLPDKHGLLYVVTLGHGRVWYSGGERYAESVLPWWFVYDPKDLADVAQGKKSRWEPKAVSSWKVSYSPRDGVNVPMETPGCCFDPETRTLFVLVPMSYKDGVSYYPLVHAYKVK